MEKLLIVIKLSDSVVVPPAAAETDDRLLLGPGYFEAQQLRLRRSRLTLNGGKVVQTPTESICIAEGQARFRAFLSQFRRIFGPKPLACLYALADKPTYLRQPDTTHNILNYFAFEADTPAGLTPQLRTQLAPLVQWPDAEAWWAEGEMPNLTDTAPPPPVATAPVPAAAPPPVENAYYQTLEAATFGFKGKGVKLIESEDFGGQPAHRYLRHVPTTVVNASSPSVTLERHFYKSLGMVFALPPAPPLPTDRPVVGLAPEASLQVFAFPPAQAGELLALFATFKTNFRQRWLLTKATTTQKAHVLLIERAVAMFVEVGKTRLFPLEVLPDIRKLFEQCAAKKLLVVQPAAWQIQDRPGLDLDVEIARMSQFLRVSQHITPLGPALPSQTILVGSVGTDGVIQPAANRGSMVDVYLWGEGITSLGLPDTFEPFRYASAAAAITAGMVATLLSAARSVGKRPSLAAMKAALTTHFRRGGADFSEATLPQVWGTLRGLL
jgi:hypothetical protein